MTTATQEHKPRPRLIRVGGFSEPPHQEKHRRPLKIVAHQASSPAAEVPICQICCEATGASTSTGTGTGTSASTSTGTATLGCCGQALCTSCLAQHARTDHRCPYCRAPFAPPCPGPRKQTAAGLAQLLSPEVLEGLAETSASVGRQMLPPSILTNRWLSARPTSRARREEIQRLLDRQAEIATLVVLQFLEEAGSSR